MRQYARRKIEIAWLQICIKPESPKLSGTKSWFLFKAPMSVNSRVPSYLNSPQVDAGVKLAAATDTQDKMWFRDDFFR